MMNSPPKLEFVGVLHQDPLGPPGLRAALSAIGQEHGQPPEWIAVEWAECSHRRAVALRNLLRFDLQTSLQNFDMEFVNALVTALGYEGDTHLELWAQTSTIWLDDRVGTHNLIANPRAFETLHRDRALVYAFGMVNARITSETPTADALALLSEQLWNDVAEQPVNEPREAVWFGAISQAVAELPENAYGIVVVGEGHLSDEGGFILGRCRDAGMACSRRSTRPAPPVTAGGD
jgi:hypothetical protein